MANGASMCWRAPWIVARVHARSGEKFRFSRRGETPRRGAIQTFQLSTTGAKRTNLDHRECRGTEL